MVDLQVSFGDAPIQDCACLQGVLAAQPFPRLVLAGLHQAEGGAECRSNNLLLLGVCLAHFLANLAMKLKLLKPCLQHMFGGMSVLFMLRLAPRQSIWVAFAVASFVGMGTWRSLLPIYMQERKRVRAAGL